MIIETKLLDTGEWEATGIFNLRGVGMTKEEAREDLLRQLSKFNDEYEREHGYRLELK